MTIKERAKKILREQDDFTPVLMCYLDYLQFEVIDGQDKHLSENKEVAERFKDFYSKNLYTLPSIRRKIEVCKKSEIPGILAQMQRNYEQINELKNVLSIFSFVGVLCENIANKTEEDSESLRDFFEQINAIYKTIPLNCPLI